MSDRAAHLTAQSLEQFAEGLLPERENESARRHLDACARCAAELDGYRSLFALLGDLPRFAPSPAFAEGVMARVSIAPQESRVAAWVRRWIPSTRRGWLLIGTLVTAPVTPFIALVALLALYPLATPTTVWQWLQIRSAGAGEATLSRALELVIGGGATEWAQAAYLVVGAIPVTVIGIAAAILAIGVPVSAWGLVRLTRHPASRVTYAN